MSLPDWLLRKLEADNPDGVTRAARLTRCPRCRTRTLTGIDDDTCGIAVTVTPIELDHYGEYIALCHGLRTYHLARRFNTSGTPRWELDWRATTHIASHHRRYPVVAGHRCGLHLPPAETSLLTAMKPAPVHHDEPPF